MLILHKQGERDQLCIAHRQLILDEEANLLPDELHWVAEDDVLHSFAAICPELSLDVPAHLAEVALDGNVRVGPDLARALRMEV